MLLEPIEALAALTKHVENRPEEAAVQCDVEISCDPQTEAVTTTEVVVKLKLGPWPSTQHDELRAGLEALQ